ncbi:MAG TPA: hypothetical protein VFG07_09495 [Thermoplasmata archaeon]|nr:hypothetical protein [Thermoplasmata archaeon]
MEISIQLDSETRNQLRAAGQAGETYDSIIRKLLRTAKYVDFMEQQYTTLDAERDWIRLSDLP